MDYSRFQVAVVEIASEGTRLTTANVVARLRVDPAKAEKWLDQMARDGRLDLEVDETEGVVVYHVRGLTHLARRRDAGGLEALLGERLGLDPDVAAHVGTAIGFGKPFAKREPLPRSLRRSIPFGVVIGGALPGLGLAYAAPWPVVVVATLIVVGGFKLLCALTLFFGIPFLFASAIASAFLGGIYTWRYNQTGRRAPLGGEPAPRLPVRQVR